MYTTNDVHMYQQALKALKIYKLAYDAGLNIKEIPFSSKQNVFPDHYEDSHHVFWTFELILKQLFMEVEVYYPHHYYSGEAQCQEDRDFWLEGTGIQIETSEGMVVVLDERLANSDCEAHIEGNEFYSESMIYPTTYGAVIAFDEEFEWGIDWSEALDVLIKAIQKNTKKSEVQSYGVAV